MVPCHDNEGAIVAGLSQPSTQFSFVDLIELNNNGAKISIVTKNDCKSQVVVAFKIQAPAEVIDKDVQSEKQKK